MNTAMMNWHLPVVNVLNRQLEQILATDPDQRYQQFQADAELRQRLIAYVLNQLPSEYVVSFSQAELATASQPTPNTTILETEIYKGLEEILHNQSGYESQIWVQSPNLNLAPDSGCTINLSHWFG